MAIGDRIQISGNISVPDYGHFPGDQEFTPVLELEEDNKVNESLYEVSEVYLGSVTLSAVRDELLGADIIDAQRLKAVNAGLDRNRRQAAGILRKNEKLFESMDREEELREQAITDPLTGLLNRRGLMRKLDRRIETVLSNEENREGYPKEGRGLALLYLDLDDFKFVNDSFGHDFGDQLLVGVAGVLNGVRGIDLVARPGGDEFTIALNHKMNLDKALAIAGRIREGILGVQVEGQSRTTGVSIGVAMVKPGMDATNLIKEADKLMYQAKYSGKNQIFSERGKYE